jgi:hypothetical protein
MFTIYVIMESFNFLFIITKPATDRLDWFLARRPAYSAFFILPGPILAFL